LRKENRTPYRTPLFKSGSGGLSKSMFPMDSSGKLDILTNLGKK
jgi:hypothetical protein